MLLLGLQMNMASHIYHSDNVWRRLTMICNLQRNTHLNSHQQARPNPLSTDDDVCDSFEIRFNSFATNGKSHVHRNYRQ